MFFHKCLSFPVEFSKVAISCSSYDSSEAEQVLFDTCSFADELMLSQHLHKLSQQFHSLHAISFAFLKIFVFYLESYKHFLLINLVPFFFPVPSPDILLLVYVFNFCMLIGKILLETGLFYH